MKAYILADETKRLVILLVLIHNVFNSIVFPFSGPLGNGLRAAGDVKFTMVVSIASYNWRKAYFFPCCSELYSRWES